MTANNFVNVGRLEERTSGRYVKTTLDLVVLAILNGKPMYGYKIMADIHKEFGVLLSPGSLYPLLHLLEEKKLVESRVEGGKKVYEPTNEGRKRLQNAFAAFRLSINHLENFVKRNGKDPPNDS
ncbi:MAG: PadR family transcriptional regulator [Candidatus Bathyarchaeia archaeon]